MKRHLFATLFGLVALLATSANANAKSKQQPARDFVTQGRQRLSIVDYFLLLPPYTFEGPTASWLDMMKAPDGGLIDTANGYMRCTGDGAQAPFEVALFRFADGRPLLAVSSGELSGLDSVFLDLYELGRDRRMHKASREIFPIPDDGYRQFILPRIGRTVVVKQGMTGKVLHRFEWDGTRFRFKD